MYRRIVVLRLRKMMLLQSLSGSAVVSLPDQIQAAAAIGVGFSCSSTKKLEMRPWTSPK